MREYKHKVGSRLKEFRKLKGYNIVKFSELAGVTHGYMSSLENNKSKPSSDLLANLCFNTDINVVWLLTGEGEPYVRKDKRNDLTHYIFDNEYQNLTNDPVSTYDQSDSLNKAILSLKKIFKSKDPVLIQKVESKIHAFHGHLLKDQLIEILGNKIKKLDYEINFIKVQLTELKESNDELRKMIK